MASIFQEKSIPVKSKKGCERSFGFSIICKTPFERNEANITGRHFSYSVARSFVAFHYDGEFDLYGFDQIDNPFSQHKSQAERDNHLEQQYEKEQPVDGGILRQYSLSDRYDDTEQHDYHDIANHCHNQSERYWCINLSTSFH